MAEFILALDQGTTSSRAILFDHDGNVRASASQEFKQYYPQPGWVEHDAEEIWQSQLAVTQKALAAARARLPDIGAIGDRKSTRLNSSHSQISYAVFCLKKKNGPISIDP